MNALRYLISYSAGLAVLIFLIVTIPLGGPRIHPHPLRSIHRTALRHAREGLPE